MFCKSKIFAFVAVALTIVSCHEKPQPPVDPVRKCVLYIGAGYNSLTSYLRNDIEDMCASKKIGPLDSGNTLLVYEHLCNKAGDFSTRVTPTLSQIYKDAKGETARRVLLTFPEVNPVYPDSVVGLDPQVIRAVIEYAMDNFKQDSFGVVISSHGTGWLPESYYANPAKFDPQWNNSSVIFSAKPQTIGEEKIGGSSARVYEMPVEDFASCFPRKIDYILIDACLMGCVEVAYELRDAASLIGFSQTEILADGLPYAELFDYLFAFGAPDVLGVCKKYIQGYKEYEQAHPYQTFRGATFSLVKTSELDLLALVCKNIFSKYREELSLVDPSGVQAFFRYNRHFFYDLEDLVASLDVYIDDEDRLTEFTRDLDLFHYVLDRCVIYEDHTNHIVDVTIKTNCGLSVYIPSEDTPFLNDFYTTLSWNKATEYILP